MQNVILSCAGLERDFADNLSTSSGSGGGVSRLQSLEAPGDSNALVFPAPCDHF